MNNCLECPRTFEEHNELTSDIALLKEITKSVTHGHIMNAVEGLELMIIRKQRRNIKITERE
jgi:hypothetical protein